MLFVISFSEIAEMLLQNPNWTYDLLIDWLTDWFVDSSALCLTKMLGCPHGKEDYFPVYNAVLNKSNQESH